MCLKYRSLQNELVPLVSQLPLWPQAYKYIYIYIYICLACPIYRITIDIYSHLIYNILLYTTASHLKEIVWLAIREVREATGATSGLVPLLPRDPNGLQFAWVLKGRQETYPKSERPTLTPQLANWPLVNLVGHALFQVRDTQIPQTKASSGCTSPCFFFFFKALQR